MRGGAAARCLVQCFGRAGSLSGTSRTAGNPALAGCAAVSRHLGAAATGPDTMVRRRSRRSELQMIGAASCVQQQRRWGSSSAGGAEHGDVPVLSTEASRLLNNLIAQYDRLAAVRDDPDAMTDMKHRELTKMTQELASLAPVVSLKKRRRRREGSLDIKRNSEKSRLLLCRLLLLLLVTASLLLLLLFLLSNRIRPLVAQHNFILWLGMISLPF